MDIILPFALLCFTSFFTLTNPLGTMPVFLTMTNGLSDDDRKNIVKRATVISFIILMAFTFVVSSFSNSLEFLPMVSALLPVSLF